MTKATDTGGTIAPLENVSRFTDLVEDLLNRPPELPGFGVFHGRAGLGKTFSAMFAVNTYRAYHYEVESCVTRRGFCLALCLEMGIDAPGRTVEDMVHQIGDHLAEHPGRPLVLDEADHLSKKGIIEIVRDIYRRCAPAGAAIVMIGENTFPAQLTRWERIDSRVLRTVRAEPLSLDDMAILASRICPGLDLESELLADLHGKVSGSARRAVARLYEVRETSIRRSWSKVTAEQWRAEVSRAAA